ncbi:MAG: hypothetical protein AB1752_09240 [Candidatus Zixiibacteriota bacterium]
MANATAVIIAAGLAIVACKDKSVPGDDLPPRLIPYMEYLSTSTVDDYVYFFFGGDTVFAGGIYRYDVVSGGQPELVVARAFAAAVSPCGDQLAYISYFGELCLIGLDTLNPDQPDFTLLAPVGPVGGATSVRWRGCDRVLFDYAACEQDSCYGVYEIAVPSLESKLLIRSGGTAASDARGAAIVYVSDAFTLNLQHDGQIDTLLHFHPNDRPISFPLLSQAGDKIAYHRVWVDTAEHRMRYDGEVFEIATGEIRHVADGATFLTWTRDRRILYSGLDSVKFREIWMTDENGTGHEQVLEYDDFYER